MANNEDKTFRQHISRPSFPCLHKALQVFFLW